MYTNCKNVFITEYDMWIRVGGSLRTSKLITKTTMRVNYVLANWLIEIKADGGLTKTTNFTKVNTTLVNILIEYKLHLITNVYDKKDSYADFLQPPPPLTIRQKIKLQHHFRKLDFTSSMKKTFSIDGNKDLMVLTLVYIESVNLGALFFRYAIILWDGSLHFLK